MKTGRYVNSKRRKFRKTKKTLYIKSRKNTRKIMKGGASEVVGLYNIRELDDVGEGKTYRYIHLTKIFGSKNEAEEFIADAKKKIGEKDVLDVQVLPYGTDTITTTEVVTRRFLPNKTVTKQVPAKYKAYFKTNSDKGIQLTKDIILNERNLNPNDTSTKVTVL